MDDNDGTEKKIRNTSSRHRSPHSESGGRLVVMARGKRYDILNAFQSVDAVKSPTDLPFLNSDYTYVFVHFNGYVL